MYRVTDGQRDKWKDRWTNGQMVRQTEEQMDGWTDGQTGIWTDRRMYR